MKSSCPICSRPRAQIELISMKILRQDQLKNNDKNKVDTFARLYGKTSKAYSQSRLEDLRK